MKIFPTIILTFLFFLQACNLGNNYELVVDQSYDHIVLEYDPNFGGDTKALLKAQKHCYRTNRTAKFVGLDYSQEPKYKQNIIGKYACITRKK